MVARRLVVGAFEMMCRVMWGFPPRMIPFIVEWFGTVRGVTWFMVNMPRYLWTLRVLGPVRTHLACVVISLHNGCTYCAYGHAYALELLYLRDHDRLFPLDARTIASWLDLEPRLLGRRIRVVLEQAGLHREAIWADRILGLVTGEQLPVELDEVRIVRLGRIVGLMNTVAIANRVEPDEAYDAVNKDAPLKARCAALRATTA